MQTTDLQHTANDAVAQSRSFISDQLDSRSTQLGEKVSSTADDLRRIANDLRNSETVSGAANIATRGADAFDRAGTYLQQADGDQLISDLESFARERPWMMALGALAAGFAASRVLKTSSARRYHSAYATD